MADFEIAVTKTIANEGGDTYTETPGDNGEATKYGISLKFLTELYNGPIQELDKSKDTIIDSILYRLPTKETIKNLTLEQAQCIYKIYFWDENRYGGIEDQDIANKVFDMSVLIGAHEANSMLQDNIQMGQLSSDGIIGDETLSVLNRCNSVDLFNINLYEYRLMTYFISICEKDKIQEQFLLDCLKRVMS